MNPRNGEVLSVLSGHNGTVSQIALSPDGRLMVSCSNKEVFLWKDEGTGFRLVDRLPEGTPAVTSAVFDSSGTLVAMTLTGNQARRVEVFRVKAGRFESLFARREG